MVKVSRSQLQAYGVTVLTVASAVLLTRLLQPLLAPTVFVLFFPAVMISALYGGMGSGLLATILSALVCKYLFLAPVYSLTITDLGTGVRLGMFLLVMLLIATVSSALSTARQRAEATLLKLRASEERYRILAENVPQLVWITRADGSVEYFNQRWLDYTGLKPDQTLGWDWQRAVHPEDLPSTLQQWTTGLSTGNPIETQYRLKRADGIYRWHIGRTLPLRNPNGEIVNWFGTGTDIHDQKQAEEALQQREQEFRTLAENSPDIIARFDRELRHVYVNPAIEQATGLPAETFIGKTNAELGFSEETYASWQDILRQTFATKQSGFIEFDFPAPDGIRYYQSRLMPEFGQDGSVQSVLGITHDLTDYKRTEQALRQSEARFRRVVESNMIGIGVWTRNGRIVEANDALLQLLGYTREDLQAGTLSWTRMTPPEYQLLDEKVLQEITAFGTCTPFEKEYIRNDGSRVPVLIGGARFEDTPDSGVFCVIDLTEGKQAEQERLQLLEALESKQRLLEAVLQQMPAGLIVAEAPSGRFVLMNEQVQKILRGSLPVADTVENYIPDSYQVFYPDGQPYTSEKLPLARSLHPGEVVTEEELDLVFPDGTRVTVAANSTPIRNAEGHIIAAVITFYDITERKQAQERIQLYADVVKNAQVGIVVWQLENPQNSSSFRLINANPAASQFTGVDFESLIGTTMAESFPTLVKTQLVSEYVEVVRTGQAKDLGEVRYGDERVTQGMYSLKAFPLPNRCLGLAFENITDRKQVEEALQDALQKLNFHVENTPLAVIERDRNFRITRWSQGAQRIFGWSAEEVTGKGLNELEFVYAEDIEAVNTLRTRLSNGDEKHNISRNRSYRKDGSIVHCEWYNSALLDESGNLVSVLSLVLDVTERERAVAALRESNRRVTNILESITAAFVASDHQWRITYVNGETARLNNMQPEEIIGKTHWEIWPWSVGTRIEQEYRRAVAEQVAVHFEIFYEPLRIWLDIHAYPSVDGLSIYYRDITERKQTQEALRLSEERFRIAQELSLDAFTILRSVRDATGQIVDFEWDYVNPKAAEILGRTPEDLTNQRLLQVLPGNKTNSELFDRYVQVVETGVPHDIEISYNAEGITGWFRNMAVKLQDGLVISFSDITKRKQAEAERINLLEREKAARTQAETANRIKDEFLAVLSHELRSPLNPILGWSKLLQTRKLDEKTIARGLETIERNAKLQTQLIEDLLDVSRILRGKLSLNISPVDLVSTIGAALETVQLAASVKSIEIQTLYEPNVGQVLGDSGRLQQVVWNLLSNAVKFTPNGGRVDIRLSINADVKDVEPEYVASDQLSNNPKSDPPYSPLSRGGNPKLNYAQIQVSDTGKGISPDFLPYVFDYFRQENSSTTRSFGGLGLGLAIVRHLVELHGGTVRVESPGEGQGATFTVWLPLMIANSETHSDNRYQQGEDAPNLRGIRILVVDDEADMREFLAFMLKEYGAEVTVVASAGEVLEALRRVKPDILLSDVGMPDVDGYMLIRQVRAMPLEQGGQIPAIALTAYAGEADQNQALSAGFQKHIAKPVEPNELAKVVASLIRR